MEKLQHLLIELYTVLFDILMIWNLVSRFHFSLEIDFMHGGKAVIFYPNELVTVINNDSRETALFILIDKMTRYHERE